MAHESGVACRGSLTSWLPIHVSVILWVVLCMVKLPVSINTIPGSKYNLGKAYALKPCFMKRL